MRARPGPPSGVGDLVSTIGPAAGSLRRPWCSRSVRRSA